MNIDIDEIIKDLERKSIPLHMISQYIPNENLAVFIRRKILEKRLGIDLIAIGSTVIDFEELKNTEIRNAIGALQI
ncbi:MAG TPA: 3-hydroxy-3-methylglutaryl-CoA reductase, partial [Ignisphaera sp.]|nr:3-hydroxy-3-methylglutaryl-CoA reductase [Ignisphaera sp.]